jgi:hypothetical protein
MKSNVISQAYPYLQDCRVKEVRRAKGCAKGCASNIDTNHTKSNVIGQAYPYLQDCRVKEVRRARGCAGRTAGRGGREGNMLSLVL